MALKLTELRALESLLADDDTSIRTMVVRELRTSRRVHEPTVSAMMKSPNPVIREVAESIISDWSKEDISDDLGTLPDHPLLLLRTWEHLESFCWDLSSEDNPDYDISEGRAQLEEMAREVAKQTPKDSSTTAEKAAAALRQTISGHGFQGNAGDYYSPSNSYLNKVLLSKMGIPLSLSLVYIFVGQRAGLNIVGLNTPGHYLCAIEDVVFDPFASGKILSQSQLNELFDKQDLLWIDLSEYEATPLDTAKRMIMNLVYCYQLGGDESKLALMQKHLDRLNTCTS